jgi:hypothetical protein
MKYEATIQFEVKDENVDLTDLIRDQKIDVHGVGLVGRTDDGEVASEMGRIWGGVVDWTPEAKRKIAQATKEISRQTSTSSWRAKACVPTPAVTSPCASFPRHWSSSKAERLLFRTGRNDALGRIPKSARSRRT